MDESVKHSLAAYFATQPVDAVYLFGSQATGNVNAMSDIDVAVLFAEGLSDSERFDLRLAVMGDIGVILKRDDVEVIDLAKAPLSLAYQVVYPKYMLYCRSRDRVVALEEKVIKHHIDMRRSLYPIAKRHLELIATEGFSYDQRR